MMHTRFLPTCQESQDNMMKLIDASNVLHSNKYLRLNPAVVLKIDHLQGVLVFDMGRSGHISYKFIPITSLNILSCKC